MSALRPKADMVQHHRDVRFVPKADMVQHHRDVRFAPKADSCTAAKTSGLGQTRQTMAPRRLFTPRGATLYETTSFIAEIVVRGCSHIVTADVRHVFSDKI